MILLALYARRVAVAVWLLRSLVDADAIARLNTWALDKLLWHGFSCSCEHNTPCTGSFLLEYIGREFYSRYGRDAA